MISIGPGHASSAERHPSSAADDRRLNLKQVASALGVHYMTVYRYVRQGRLVAERAGTSWQVDPAELAAFLSGGTAGKAATEHGGTDWAERLERCLLAGDEASAWRVLSDALASGHGPVECYLEILSAALESIGRRFGAGELLGVDHHVSTTLAGRLVARLGARFRRPGRSRGAVVFGAPPGELHALPIAIAADVVRLAGFSVVELGGDVPAAVFAEAAARTPRLVAVGVGVTVAERLVEVPAIIDALGRLRPPPPVLVGGLAARQLAAGELEGVHVVEGDAREAVALLEGLVVAGSSKA